MKDKSEIQPGTVYQFDDLWHDQRVLIASIYAGILARMDAQMEQFGILAPQEISPVPTAELPGTIQPSADSPSACVQCPVYKALRQSIASQAIPQQGSVEFYIVGAPAGENHQASIRRSASIHRQNRPVRFLQALCAKATATGWVRILQAILTGMKIHGKPGRIDVSKGRKAHSSPDSAKTGGATANQ